MAVGSFSAGLSGLNANAQYLSVIGNNLANINTIAFKASTVTFMDLVSQAVSGNGDNPMQVGLGVVTGSISPVFTQGAIESARGGTNVAIEGDGFFVVSGADGQSFTRAGNFTFDKNGTLVTADGYHVQGYTRIDPATGTVVSTGETTDITVPPGVLRPPTATTEFKMVTNLSASAPAGAVHTSAIEVRDALGASHVVTITYTKTGAGQWTYEMTVPGEDATGGTAGTPFPIPAASGGSGTLTFDDTGKLTTINGQPPADLTITTPAWSTGAAANTLSWDLVGDDNAPYLTGYAADSDTSAISQNGAAAGVIDSIDIQRDGTILAVLRSGQQIPVGQIALATFTNPKGLLKLGSNRFASSEAAGVANIGVADSGGRGTLVGGALEQSNVDMAQEFTQMILAQRGYQANAKSITVSDELLVDTLNLKR